MLDTCSRTSLELAKKIGTIKKKTIMLCPTCTSELSEAIIKGITVDECTSCGTIWFDAGEMDTYITATFPEKKSPSIASRFEPLECSYEEFCPTCRSQKLLCGRIGNFSLSKCEKCSGILIKKDQIESLKFSKNDSLAEYFIVDLVCDAMFSILNKL
jgi:Zn-finger nucleic acid-binding protein